VIRLAVTVDVGGAIEVIDGKVHHLGYEQSLHTPCLLLSQIAERYGLKITFFVPLGELLEDYPEVIRLLSRLAEKHDCQALVHLPVTLMKREAIVDRLVEEASLHERYLDRPPKAIRAGGHNVGDDRKWIDCIMEAGYAIDSSVWPGASTVAGRDISAMAVPAAESRWGTGAVQFDFRGAPLTGAYFADKDTISRPGNSSLLEVPVTVRDYSERRPFFYRFDFQYQDMAGLKSTLSRFIDEEARGEELMLNLATQSAGNMYSLRWRRWQHCGPNYRLKRFEAFARWLNRVHLGSNVASISLGEIDPHVIRPVVRWSREQPEYFGARRICDKPGRGDLECRKGKTTVMLGEDSVAEQRQSLGLAVDEVVPRYVAVIDRMPFVQIMLRRLAWARQLTVDVEHAGMVCQIPFVHSVLRRLAGAWRFTEDTVLSVSALLCLLATLPWALWAYFDVGRKGKHGVAENAAFGRPRHAS